MHRPSPAARTIGPAIIVLALIAGPAISQDQATPSPTAVPQDEPASRPGSRMETAAELLLTRMSERLQKLKSFELKAEIDTDAVLDNDQKIEISGTATYQVRRPDGLKAELTTDIDDRVIYYDGRTLTVSVPDQKIYAQTAAAPTLAGMLEDAAANLQIEIPLADLFDWGSERSPEKSVYEGFVIGRSRIGGVDTEHVAFRSDDYDWEVWIRAGDDPLPLKIAVTNTADVAQPRHETVLTWTATEASLGDETFTFKPAENQERVRFLTASGDRR